MGAIVDGERPQQCHRRRDGDMEGWDAQRRDGGEDRRERRARRVNHGNREERRERRRGQERVSGGGPRGRQESDERGRDRKDEGEGGRVPATIPAAAAANGDGRRARTGDPHKAAGAGNPTRTSTRRRR